MSDIFNAVLKGPADIIIGKNGLGAGQFQNLETILKRKKIIKIKVMKEIAHEQGIEGFIKTIMNQLKVFVLDARGFTFILSKRKIPGVNIPKKFSVLMEKDEISTEEHSSDLETDQNDNENIFDSNVENTLELEEESELGESVGKDPVESKNKARKAKRQTIRQDTDFIDYDDKELLDEIDKEADEIFGVDEGNRLEENKEIDRTTQRQNWKPTTKKTSRRPLPKKKTTYKQPIHKKMTFKQPMRKKTTKKATGWNKSNKNQ